MSSRNKALCQDCGLVFVSPLPSQAEWDVYNSDYFNIAHGKSHLADRAVAFRSGLGKIRAAFVKQYAETLGADIRSVIEIGPGFGEFAAAWLNDSADVDYAAIETDQSLLPDLEKQGIHIWSSFESVKQAQKRYDLVVASHVLEHTLDPVRFLKDMAALSKTSGLIFIEVPCQDFLYKALDEPHTMFFDQSALVAACTQAGLGTPYLTYHGETRTQLQAELRHGLFAKLFAKVLTRLKPYFAGTDMRVEGCRLTAREKSILEGFSAHIVQPEPSRWVRMIVDPGAN